MRALLFAAVLSVAHGLACPTITENAVPNVLLYGCSQSATGTIPHMTACTPRCNPTGTGTFSGTFYCKNGTYVNNLTNACRPYKMCPPLPMDALLAIQPNCTTPTMANPHMKRCSATCPAGYSGSVTGYKVCQDGQWVEGFTHSCTPPPCNGGYTQAGYIVEGCDPMAGSMTVASGTICSARCASGLVGYPQGRVMCSKGQWLGGYTGCQAKPCPAYQQVGYVSTCQVGTPDKTQCDATCAPGFTGSVGGGVVCNNGSYTGSLQGCTPDAAVRCKEAYTQPGYVLGGENCSALAPAGAVCRATDCAAGYAPDGPIAGGAICAGGKFFGALRGCRKPSECALPAWLCDSTTGTWRPQYDVAAYLGSAAQIVPRSCAVTDKTFVKVACAKGYSLKGGTLSFGFCVGGNVTGGWATSSPPTCDLVKDAPCVCGAAGETRGDMTINKGATRVTGDAWNGPGHACFVSSVNGKQAVNCFCRCSA